MKEYRVIIAGGRDFDDYTLLANEVIKFLPELSPHKVEIVSGGQVTKKDDGIYCGADFLGEKFAAQYSYPCKVFPANWEKFGKGAGPRRNITMGDYSTHLIAFDTGGKGTAHMVEYMRKLNKVIRVVDCRK